MISLNIFIFHAGTVLAQQIRKSCSLNIKNLYRLLPSSQACGNIMPDLSDVVHFIEDKLEISIYLSLDNYECIIGL